MKQIIYIHGGMIFPNNDKYFEVLSKRDYNPSGENRKKWKQWLTEQVTGQFCNNCCNYVPKIRKRNIIG